MKSRIGIEEHHETIIKLAKNHTTKEIADKLDYRYQNIYQYCRNHEIETLKGKNVKEYDDEVRELAKTKTTKEVADQLGFAISSVVNYGKKNGISFFKNKTIHEYKDEIIKMANTMTVSEIAEKIDYSDAYVSTYLKKLGIMAKGMIMPNQTDDSWWKPIDIEINENTLLADYHQWWCFVYKEPSVHNATFTKYKNANQHVRHQLPNTKLKDVTRSVYQGFMNRLGETLAKRSIMSINNCVKRPLQDAVYEGILEKDPTYGLEFSGQPVKETHKKFISESELDRLLESLDYGTDLSNNDTKSSWVIFLGAKTGFRLGEILGLTTDNFDFENNKLTIDKTLNYKDVPMAFQPTKNKSSMRTVSIDNITMTLFRNLISNVAEEVPIFAQDDKRVHASNFNNYLTRKCKETKIPRITVHSLRHTHASVLLANGVSMQTVSNRLGHSDLSTTQNVYSHITDELARKDDEKMNASLSKLGGF